MTGQIVKTTKRFHWMKGAGFHHHRFELKSIQGQFAEVYGPIIYDQADGWVPDPSQSVSRRFVPADAIEWVD